MPPTKRKKKSSLVIEEDEEGDDNNSNIGTSTPPLQGEDDDDEDEETKPINFTQHATLELSQSLPAVKESERIKLQSLNSTSISSAVTDLSRLILFKSLAKEPIDRLKCIDDALKDLKDQRVSNAIFEKSAQRLLDVFGFEICSAPIFMRNELPSAGKFKDRYYVINSVVDDDGTHARRLHDNEESTERGVLMVVLAFTFCKGGCSKDGKGGGRAMRWIAEKDLYRLLNAVDDNIPEEPPRDRKRRKSSVVSNRITFDIDLLLEKFVQMDYLLKDKQTEGDNTAAAAGGDDGDCFIYAMGPRAALEIGRRQLVYFCAEILDEQPDPTMLMEIDDEIGEKEEEKNDNEG